MKDATPTLHISGELTEGLHMFDKAHLVMLAESGIVSREDAGEALKVLLEMEKQGLRQVREGTESGIHAGEVYLIRTLGMETGGRIHAGRSSADLTFVSTQIRMRSLVLDVMEKLNAYRGALLTLAGEHTETVMANYTHGQHAQPTTFGHYLHSFCCAAERDFRLLDLAYTNANVSTAGVVAGTASNFHTDRERIAELLGFDSVSANTKDSYYLREYLAWQISAALTIITASLGRLADDLITWCGQEYRLIRIADAYCDTSSIMAHKRNPLSVEYIQEVRDKVTGRVCTSYDLELLLSASAATNSALKLMTRVMNTLEIDGSRMLELVTSNWAQIPDLAGVLVLERDLPWRVAHQIVAILVRLAEEEGLGPEEVTPRLLDRAAIEYMGVAVKLPPELIRKALDPEACIRDRVVTGSPGAAEVRKQIRASLHQLAGDRETIDRRKAGLAAGERRLAEAVGRIIG
jgi:argininosuccinate lyase